MTDITVKRRGLCVVLAIDGHGRVDEIDGHGRVDEIELVEAEARALIVRLETALCRGYGRDLAQVRAGHARMTGKSGGEVL